MTQSTDRSPRSRLGIPQWLGATLLVVGIVALLVVVLLVRVGRHPFSQPALTTDLERQGQQVFRYDTFGNEQFWTDTARMHEVVGQHIQPIEALRLGIKVS